MAIQQQILLCVGGVNSAEIYPPGGAGAPEIEAFTLMLPEFAALVLADGLIQGQGSGRVFQHFIRRGFDGRRLGMGSNRGFGKPDVCHKREEKYQAGADDGLNHTRKASTLSPSVTSTHAARSRKAATSGNCR